MEVCSKARWHGGLVPVAVRNDDGLPILVKVWSDSWKVIFLPPWDRGMVNHHFSPPFGRNCIFLLSQWLIGFELLGTPLLSRENKVQTFFSGSRTAK